MPAGELTDVDVASRRPRVERRVSRCETLILPPMARNVGELTQAANAAKPAVPFRARASTRADREVSGRSPAVVRERLVSLRHLVRVVPSSPRCHRPLASRVDELEALASSSRRAHRSRERASASRGRSRRSGPNLGGDLVGQRTPTSAALFTSSFGWVDVEGLARKTLDRILHPEALAVVTSKTRAVGMPSATPPFAVGHPACS